MKKGCWKRQPFFIVYSCSFGLFYIKFVSLLHYLKRKDYGVRTIGQAPTLTPTYF